VNAQEFNNRQFVRFML